MNDEQTRYSKQYNVPEAPPTATHPLNPLIENWRPESSNRGEQRFYPLYSSLHPYIILMNESSFA